MGVPFQFNARDAIDAKECKHFPIPDAHLRDCVCLLAPLALLSAYCPLPTAYCSHPVHLTTYRGLITAAAPRSLALKRTTMSWLKSASLPGGDWVTVIGQFSM